MSATLATVSRSFLLRYWTSVASNILATAVETSPGICWNSALDGFW